MKVPDDEEERAPTPAEGAGDRRGTILVIEDEAAVLRVARRSLERYGYSVLTASSGEEGISLLDERGDEVDLVLSDVVMAGMGGREVQEAVERMRPGLPVILMSGYPVDREGRPERVEEGSRFLRKPFSPGELAERVEEVLRRAGGKGPVPTAPDPGDPGGSATSPPR